MKIYLVALFAVSIIVNSQTLSDIKVTGFQELALESQEVQQSKIKKLRRSNFETLTKAKVFLINGNFNRALDELQSLKKMTPENLLIRDRYLSIIFALQGKFELTEKILSRNVYQIDPLFTKICPLYTLSMIAIDKQDGLADIFERCFIRNRSQSETDFQWFEAIIDMVKLQKDFFDQKKLSTLEKYTTNVDETIMWLKTILFLNKEDKILNKLEFLPLYAFQNKRIREIIGLILYRLGRETEAKEFVEDINLANAQNILGNLALDKKQYEIAYGHYKIALKKKGNSINAIKRIIPLVWLNQQYKDGLAILDLASDVKLEVDGRKTYRAALFTKLNENKKVIRLMQEVQNKYTENTPEPISELLSYNYLKIGELDDSYNYADKACKKYDGINCYLQISLRRWPNLFKTLSRLDRVSDFAEVNLNKLITGSINEPIEENVFVDQGDIEELDGIDQKRFLIIN